MDDGRTTDGTSGPRVKKALGCLALCAAIGSSYTLYALSENRDHLLLYPALLAMMAVATAASLLCFYATRNLPFVIVRFLTGAFASYLSFAILIILVSCLDGNLD